MKGHRADGRQTGGETSGRRLTTGSKDEAAEEDGQREQRREAAEGWDRRGSRGDGAEGVAEDVWQRQGQRRRSRGEGEEEGGRRSRPLKSENHSQRFGNYPGVTLTKRKEH